jgi:hypothetical protein
MAIDRDITKIREAVQRIGVAGRAATITGELDPVAVVLDTQDALQHVLGALEEPRAARGGDWRRR